MKIKSFSFVFALVAIVNGCSPDQQPEMIGICSNHIFPIEGDYVSESRSIQLKWNGASNFGSYDVYVGAAGNEPELVASNIPVTHYSFDVPAGTDISYTWYVKARDLKNELIECTETSSTFKSKTLPALMTSKKIVKVLVLNYDPIVTYQGASTPLHQYFNWFDPHVLADGFIHDVLEASSNTIEYEIVEWRDINEYPTKTDGYVYNDSAYMKCMSYGTDHSACHSNDGLDYIKMIEDQHVAEGIDDNTFEEVWMFGGPYFGYWESAMAGPRAIFMNGSAYPSAKSKKAFAVMGFNYERGVAEMMHDLCHRTESLMSAAYSGWRAEQLTTAWAKFAANKKQTPNAAAGSCHYPPNARFEYDYTNSALVSSSAEDWFNYPLLTGEETMVGGDTWGGADYQRNYLIWWFSHLPRREGIASDGKLNNWWRYIYEFNETVLPQ